MRIVQVSSYFPPHIGGIEFVAREISEGLAKKGHQVEVFTSNIGCPKNKQLKSTKNLKINYLPCWEFAHTGIIPTFFSRLIRVQDGSIIHVHIAQAFTPEIVWLVSKLRRIPYVIHIHGNVEKSGNIGFLLPIYKRIFLKKVLRDAKKIIVLNKDYKNFIKKNYKISKNIVIVPNGAEDRFFINKKIRSFGMKNLLYVGRLSVEKNIPKLIEAFSLLKNDGIRLDIVGDGEKRKDIEDLIKEKKLKNIILHGRKEGKELLNLYKKADIFLLASDSEGLPLVLLEAMATGTPIIASDVRGINNLIKRVGILVNPPTPENFAKEIDKLIENPRLRKALSKKGIEKAKLYSWDKIVSQTEQVYREVLKEHNKNETKT